MKVIVKSFSEKALEKYDWRDLLSISIDGKEEFNVGDGEPEDANLSRDFSDCWIIPELIAKAYLAGKRGESFELEKVKVDNEDDL